MKTCPYCAEEIQDAAIKCRYCGEMLDGPPPPPSAQKNETGSSVGKTGNVDPSRVAGRIVLVIGGIVLAFFALFHIAEKINPTYTRDKPTPKIYGSTHYSVSDGETSPDEAEFHNNARSFIVGQVKPNELGVDGSSFRVKSNPSGRGCFVYNTRTHYAGVKRPQVWWVPEDGKGYALNIPSKVVTPDLPLLNDDGYQGPDTSDVLAFVFDDKALPTQKDGELTSRDGNFTVREYRIYSEIVNSPTSVPESEIIERLSREHSVSANDVMGIAEKVMKSLSRNHWFSSPIGEIRHATDWSGETS